MRKKVKRRKSKPAGDAELKQSEGCGQISEQSTSQDGEKVTKFLGRLLGFGHQRGESSKLAAEKSSYDNCAETSTKELSTEKTDDLVPSGEFFTERNLLDVNEGAVTVKKDAVYLNEDAASFKEDAVNVNEGAVNIHVDAVKITEDAEKIKEDAVKINGDAVKINEDAEKINEDAEKIKEDAGKFEEDAGKIKEDAETIKEDAGKIKEDAIYVNEDAVDVKKDAGCARRNAGCLNEDENAGCAVKNADDVKEDADYVKEDAGCVAEDTSCVTEDADYVAENTGCVKDAALNVNKDTEGSVNKDADERSKIEDAKTAADNVNSAKKEAEVNIRQRATLPSLVGEEILQKGTVDTNADTKNTNMHVETAEGTKLISEINSEEKNNLVINNNNRETNSNLTSFKETLIANDNTVGSDEKNAAIDGLLKISETIAKKRAERENLRKNFDEINGKLVEIEKRIAKSEESDVKAAESDVKTANWKIHEENSLNGEEINSNDEEYNSKREENKKENLVTPKNTHTQGEEETNAKDKEENAETSKAKNTVAQKSSNIGNKKSGISLSDDENLIQLLKIAKLDLTNTKTKLIITELTLKNAINTEMEFQCNKKPTKRARRKSINIKIKRVVSVEKDTKDEAVKLGKNEAAGEKSDCKSESVKFNKNDGKNIKSSKLKFKDAQQEETVFEENNNKTEPKIVKSKFKNSENKLSAIKNDENETNKSSVNSSNNYVKTELKATKSVQSRPKLGLIGIFKARFDALHKNKAENSINFNSKEAKQTKVEQETFKSYIKNEESEESVSAGVAQIRIEAENAEINLGNKEITSKSEEIKTESEDAKEESEEIKTESEDAKEEREVAKEDSETAKEESEEAKGESEAAKEGTEDAKEENEDAKEESEDAKEESEAAKEESVDAKEGSEEIKTESEDAKEESEDAKEESEAAKEGSEDAKEESEAAMEESEDAKEGNEEIKTESEDAKEGSEDAKEELRSKREEANTQSEETKETKAVDEETKAVNEEMKSESVEINAKTLIIEELKLKREEINTQSEETEEINAVDEETKAVNEEMKSESIEINAETAIIEDLKLKCEETNTQNEETEETNAVDEETNTVNEEMKSERVEINADTAIIEELKLKREETNTQSEETEETKAVDEEAKTVSEEMKRESVEINAEHLFERISAETNAQSEETKETKAVDKETKAVNEEMKSESVEINAETVIIEDLKLKREEKNAQSEEMKETNTLSEETEKTKAVDEETNTVNEEMKRESVEINAETAIIEDLKLKREETNTLSEETGETKAVDEETKAVNEEMKRESVEINAEHLFERISAETNVQSEETEETKAVDEETKAVNEEVKRERVEINAKTLIIEELKLKREEINTKSEETEETKAVDEEMETVIEEMKRESVEINAETAIIEDLKLKREEKNAQSEEMKETNTLSEETEKTKAVDEETNTVNEEIKRESVEINAETAIIEDLKLKREETNTQSEETEETKAVNEETNTVNEEVKSESVEINAETLIIEALKLKREETNTQSEEINEKKKVSEKMKTINEEMEKESVEINEESEELNANTNTFNTNKTKNKHTNTKTLLTLAEITEMNADDERIAKAFNFYPKAVERKQRLQRSFSCDYDSRDSFGEEPSTTDYRAIQPTCDIDGCGCNNKSKKNSRAEAFNFNVVRMRRHSSVVTFNEEVDKNEAEKKKRRNSVQFAEEGSDGSDELFEDAIEEVSESECKDPSVRRDSLYSLKEHDEDTVDENDNLTHSAKAQIEEKPPDDCVKKKKTSFLKLFTSKKEPPKSNLTRKYSSAIDISTKSSKPLKRSSSFLKKKLNNLINNTTGEKPTNFLKRSLSFRNISDTSNNKPEQTNIVNNKSLEWRQSLQNLKENDNSVNYSDFTFVNYDELNLYNYNDAEEEKFRERRSDKARIWRTQSMLVNGSIEARTAPKLTRGTSLAGDSFTQHNHRHHQSSLDITEHSSEALSLPSLHHLSRENSGNRENDAASPECYTGHRYRRRPQSVSSEDGRQRPYSSANGSFRSSGSGCSKLKRANACRQKSRTVSGAPLLLKPFNREDASVASPAAATAAEDGSQQQAQQQEWKKFVGSIRRRVQRHAEPASTNNTLSASSSSAGTTPAASRKNSLTQSSRFDFFRREKSREEKDVMKKSVSIKEEKTPRLGSLRSKSGKKEAAAANRDDFLQATMRIFLVVSPPVGKMQVRSRSLNHLDTLDMRQGVPSPSDAALKDARSEPDCTRPLLVPGAASPAGAAAIVNVEQPSPTKPSPPQRRHVLSRSQKSSSECFSVSFEIGDEVINETELFFPAIRGVTLHESVAKQCGLLGVELSCCDAWLSDREGVTQSWLSLSQDTACLVGKHVRINQRDPAAAAAAASPRCKLTSSAPHARKLSGNFRPKTGGFFSSSTEDASSLSANWQHADGKGVQDFDYKKQTKQRWSGLFGNNKDTKQSMEQLIEQLGHYSKYGVPSTQSYSMGHSESTDALYKLEDDWRDIINVSELNDRQQKQQTALWELIKTEVAYIKTLKVVTDLFLACLLNLQQSNILKEIDTAKLFSNIGDILEANVQFWRNSLWPLVKDMRGYGRPACIETMCDGFLKMREGFQAYHRFCGEQSRCQHYCRENLSHNDIFTAYLAWCETQKECNRLRLMDILVQPMQRLTKYGLLLKAILKNTDDEVERDNLGLMIRSVDDFVNNVNSGLKQKQDNERLKGIIARIESYDIVETKDDDLEKLIKSYNQLDLNKPMLGCPPEKKRHLLLEGDLKLKDSSTSKIEVHCFLLTDMLLVCKSSTKKGGATMRVIRQPYLVDRLVVHELTKETPTLACVYKNEFDMAVAAFILQNTDSKKLKSWKDGIAKAQKLYAQARSSYFQEESLDGGGTELGFELSLDADFHCLQAPRSPLASSSRASRVSSLAHSHSGSVEMNDQSSIGSTKDCASRAVSVENDNRTASISSDEGVQSLPPESSKSPASQKNSFKHRLFNKTPNTLSVQPYSHGLGQSLPNLALGSPNTGTVSFSGNTLSVPSARNNGQQLLSPTHRGISYPPPSPTRGNLRRGLAISQGKNPPLIKTRHVTSTTGTASTATGPPASFDFDVPVIAALSSDNKQQAAAAESNNFNRGHHRQAMKRVYRNDNKRYHTAGAVDDIKKSNAKDASIHKRLSWNCGSLTDAATTTTADVVVSSVKVPPKNT